VRKARCTKAGRHAGTNPRLLERQQPTPQLCETGLLGERKVPIQTCGLAFSSWWQEST
jgi:hypothetical protein